MRYQFNECVAARLRRISRTVDNIYRENLSDEPITEQQMTMLFYLKMRGSCDQGAIGKALVLERSTVSRNVKALVNDGYVQKSDDYRPILQLSQSGLDLVDHLAPLWENIMVQITTQLGQDNIQLIENIESKLL